jgi:hypothetical protein
LQIIGQLLSTRTGRLYKGLVLNSKVATEASAAQDSMKYAGYFVADGEVAEGHTPDEVEQAIYREIEKLQQEEVPAKELQKVKNNFAANEYRRLGSNMAILQQLIRTDGDGHWSEINEAGPKLQAVTAEDIRRVAQKYFNKENRTVCTFTRKGGPAAEDPDLAGLTDEQKAFVKQTVAKLKTATDVAKLKEGLAKMTAGLEQAPPEVKPALEVIIKKLQARITQLESSKN